MNGLYLAFGILVSGGLLAALFGRQRELASAIGSTSAVAGAAVGLFAAVDLLSSGDAVDGLRPIPGALHGSLVLGADALSAFFLVAVFVLGGFAAAYGRDYWLDEGQGHGDGQEEHERGVPRPLGGSWLAFNSFLASLVLVLVARDAVLFLVGWESMSLLAFLLVATEHDKPEVRRAGWVYLIATHIGTAFVTAMFLVLATEAKGLEYAAFARTTLPEGTRALVFLLAVLGFGVKAGFAPLHVWLPEAHAAAPSHVSALMSGVLIKIGLYGLLRTLMFLGAPAAWWGGALIVIGLTGGLLGIAIGAYQRDLKRVLAYSSIVNIGLITLALGRAIWGRAQGLRALAAVAGAGALLHLWNHTLMKGLMFLSAGSVLHGAGTKDLERLGGLMKRMPRTATLMMVGATAIAALPPMNGFASEWLIYLGLIDGGRSGGIGGMTFFLVAGVVATIGGTACLCFVRLIGTSLLGEPRSLAAREAKESPDGMIVPMAALALLSMAIAVFPRAALGLLGPALTQLLGGFATLADIGGAPLETLGVINLALVLALVGGGFGLSALLRRRPLESGQTWGCGYVAPTPRMQYTGRSFVELLSEHLLPRAFRPKVFKSRPSLAEPASASSEAPRARPLFMPQTEFGADGADPLTRGVYEPFMSGWASRVLRLRWVQQGNLQLYLAYIVIIAMLLIGWLSVRDGLVGEIGGWFQP
jgi:formate hydrogenlyase subunit 3/multisubunit Na+/H+ antiporter MnhD subunit